MTKAIRASTGLGLRDAKQRTDACEAGESFVVGLRPDVVATDFIATVRDLGFGAQIIEHDEFDPKPQKRLQHLQEWNRTVDHELQWDDFCRADSPWCYFVAAPLRSIDIFAGPVTWRQTEPGQQTVVRMIRGRHCPNSRAVLQEWSAALQFPYYFGHNWDAFDECITDLEWLPGSCYVFFVTDLDQVLPHAPHDFAILISALQFAASEWKRPNRYNTDEPTAAFTVVFHAEPHKAAKELARLRAAGADPIVSRFSEEFLKLSAEPELHYGDRPT